MRTENTPYLGAEQFELATHLLRDDWREATRSRIEALRADIDKAEAEITALRQAEAEMIAFTSKVVGMPKLAIVEWTKADQKIVEKFASGSTGDKQEAA